MALKTGAFITITRPEERGDTHKECIAMAKELFDVVTIIDGEDTWPKEFMWNAIGEHFQQGYEECDADWVFHLDTDFIFHQQDFSSIRRVCEEHNDKPALSFWKYQFVQPDRYNLKSRLVIAVNKGKFGDRIKFNSGGDLCQPSLDGEYLSPDNLPEARIPFYNYEKLLKTKDQVNDDVGRMDRAYFRHFGKYIYGSGDDESAYKGWLEMMIGRYHKPSHKIKITDHPIYVQKTIKNLQPEQFGYNAHGNLKENSYF